MPTEIGGELRGSICRIGYRQERDICKGSFLGTDDMREKIYFPEAGTWEQYRRIQEAKYSSNTTETTIKTPQLHHLLDSDGMPAESSVNQVTNDEKVAKKIRIKKIHGRFLPSRQIIENSRQNFIAKSPELSS